MLNTGGIDIHVAFEIVEGHFNFNIHVASSIKVGFVRDNRTRRCQMIKDATRRFERVIVNLFLVMIGATYDLNECNDVPPLVQ